ncbi:hypothetical protein EDC96DRAFT_530717 [Choanephora cucurbitarum]|nr:hypothetical protein EDC96DRAFT_530717 [Choanephora cucurbitarum]
MVSFSNLLFAGVALIIGVSAAPSADSHQDLKHYHSIVESGFALQPRACREICCTTPLNCCLFYGGTYKDGHCQL